MPFPSVPVRSLVRLGDSRRTTSITLGSPTTKRRARVPKANRKARARKVRKIRLAAKPKEITRRRTVRISCQGYESEAGEVSRILSDIIGLTQALEGLVSYSLGGRNPVADLKQQLKVAPDCGGMPSLQGLFPLCLTSCSNSWLSEYKPLDVDSPLVISLSVGVVNALIVLFAGSNADKPAATLAIGSLGVAHGKCCATYFLQFRIY